LAPDGLDQKRGIVFEIPKEVHEVLPPRVDCTDASLRD
jgi:hypothetical protein